MKHAEVAIARRALRQLWVSAAVCALAFGATVAASAVSYVSSFPTQASRDLLVATTGHDAGLTVLLGPISAIGTVGGYTFYKVFLFLTTIGALWGLLAATRLLRGEEDAGRWQLTMAGNTRPDRATVATMGGIAGAIAFVFLGTVLLTLLAGRKEAVAFGAGETVLFGLSMVIPAAVFVGVGAVTSQLGRTRRAANGLGMVVFAVAYVLRMVADSGQATKWILWTTPFGWSERMAPLTRNDLAPLLPAVVVVFVLGAVAVGLASRRDAGQGALSSHDVTHVRPFGLRSTLTLTVRMEMPVLGAWCAGAFVSGMLFGVVAKMVTGPTPGSIRDTLDKLGVHGSLVNQYLGVAFLMIATIVALLPAGQIGAAADEETSGRIVHVLARATRRGEWLVGRVALAATTVVFAALLAGFGAWLGAKTQGVGLSVATMLGAGLNVVPTALVALGVGIVVLAIAPRRAGLAVYAVIIWSLAIDLAASLISGLQWLERFSLYHYMALVPAGSADLWTLAITTAVAVALCAVGVVIFRRRDLQLT